MIDTKAHALHEVFPPVTKVQVDDRMALLFNGLAIGAAALAAVLPLGVAIYWFTTSAAAVAGASQVPLAAIATLSMPTRLGAVALSLLSVAPLSWALLRLRVCFGQFAQGRPFAARGIAGLRDFAVGVAISAVAKPISFTLLTLLLSWQAPAGQRQLAIRLDGETLIMVLFAATIAALAWAMQKAAAIAEENSQFI